jgi:ribose transport system substrate-binding protein
MKPLHGLVWAGALLALAGLIGCKGSGKPRVAFVSNNPESFWSIAQAGAKKAAEEHDVELLFRMPTSGDASVQKEVIDTVLAQGVKAVAISVIDPKNQSDYLDEVAGKVKLLTVDNDAPKTRRLAYIGTDIYQAGRAAGKLVKEAMPKGGTVVIFVGQLEALNARQRRQGVIDELAGNDPPKDLNDFKPTPDGGKYGDYKLFEKTYLDQPEGSSKALDNAIDALAQIPAKENLCMVGLWAYNPPQCLAAVKSKVKDKDPERLKRISIVGFDEDFGTLDGVKEGSVYATVVQNPYEFGYQSVKTMAALARGDESGLPKDKLLYVPVRIVAKEAGDRDGLKRISVDVFRPELEKLLGKGK